MDQKITKNFGDTCPFAEDLLLESWINNINFSLMSNEMDVI